MTRPTKRTVKKRNAFLTALAAGNSVTAAAAAAGIGRTAVYDWRDDDSEFAAAWDAAAEESTDLLEEEARRRALSASDVLLIFLLKARRPHIYREPRSAAVVALSPEDMAALEQARRIREMSPEELESEIAGIQKRHEIADQARAMVDAIPRKPNGRAP
jgi:hypothetical protein